MLQVPGRYVRALSMLYKLMAYYHIHMHGPHAVTLSLSLSLSNFCIYKKHTINQIDETKLN